MLISVFAHAQTVEINASRECLGTPTTISQGGNIHDSIVVSRAWDLDDDGAYDDGTFKSFDHLLSATGSHTIHLRVITTADDTLTATETATIDPLPEVNFTAENLCATQVATYSDESTIESGSITQFLWDFNNDGVTDDTGPMVNYTCGPAQTYTTRLTCESDQGCRSFAEKTTAVRHFPNAGFTANRLCAADSTEFDNTTTLEEGSLALSVWDFGDGLTENSTEDVRHMYAATGTYSVSLLTVTEFGCRDSLTSSVTISELPEASVDLLDGSTIYSGQSAAVALVADNAQTITWSNGESTETASYGDPGNHHVTVSFDNGCARTVSFSLSQEIVSGVEIESNIISPNGDGINEYFIIQNVLAGENCELTIVNRWNDVVYSSSDYQNDWDGTNGGKELETGAYFYIIKCGTAEPVTGDINILR